LSIGITIGSKSVAGPYNEAVPEDATHGQAEPGTDPESERTAGGGPNRAVGKALTTWLARDRYVALTIFVCALVLRAFHLHALSIHDPFYTIASVDGAVYDAWARELVAGDWRGDGVLFLGPLYPMFMASVYSIFGPSLPAVKMIQVVLGALSCVLVWGLAREIFGRRIAALTGLASILYGMHVFYGGTTMIVNLQVPLVVGLAWASIRALHDPTYRGWALCGLLLGLSALARQTVLLLAPVLALWVLFGMKGDYSFGQRFAFGSTFGVVICLLVLPFTIKNYVVGDDLVLLNSTGGANFYMGNQRNADGTWQIPSIGWNVRVDNPRTMRDAFTGVAERETGRSLKPSEVSSYWQGRGVDEIRADPFKWIRLEFRKAALFVNAHEVWNNRSVEVSKRASWVLRLPLVSFGLIAPFALLGLILTAGRWREFLPVHGAIGAYLIASLLFFVLSRYRMPATFLMLPFAAFAAFELAGLLRTRAWAPFAIRAVAIILLGLFVHLPLVNEDRMHMAWYNLGNKYRELERWDEAINAYQTSLEENPQSISTHNNIAIAFELGGRSEEAIRAWQQVEALGQRIRSARHIDRAKRHLRTLQQAAEPAPL
jgi:4-amino-4-deoxy-L-arabinose transferase-like glycosyltransferase